MPDLAIAPADASPARTDKLLTLNFENVTIGDALALAEAADSSYDNTASGLDATDVQSAIDEIAGGGGGSGIVESIVAGTNVSVDSTDPANPIVSAAGAGSGDVVGPASSTDNHVALFDGVTGKILKDGGALGSMSASDDAPSDGTGYVRKNGAWAAESGGGGSLTNWTEGVNSSTPNIGTPVVSLKVTNAATNVDAAIVPKGNGAVLASIPDGTAAGGNKRGSSSVDFQTERTNASQVASNGYASILGGRNNTASGQFSTCLGGDGSSSVGGYSIAFGQSCTASGSYSVALGRSNTASQDYGFAWGRSSTAGLQAFAGGYVAVASGTCSGAVGESVTADANYSWATGQYSHTRGIIGSRSHACGRINGVSVDAQWRDFVLYAKTTSGTAVDATSNGSGASTNNQVVIPNNSAMLVRADIIARQNATGDTKSWETRVTVKRGANAASTSIVGTPVVTVCDADAGASAWDLAVTADTTRGGLTYTVTGEASKAITWTVVPQGPEVVG